MFPNLKRNTDTQQLDTNFQGHVCRTRTMLISIQSQTIKVVVVVDDDVLVFIVVLVVIVDCLSQRPTFNVCSKFGQ